MTEYSPTDPTDEQLEALLKGDPSLLRRAEQAASSAWREARLRPIFDYAAVADRNWEALVTLVRQADAPAARHRLTLAAGAVMRKLCELPHSDMVKLAVHFGKNNCAGPDAVAPARAVMAAHPELAWLQSEVDRQAAERQEAERRTQERQVAAWRAARPGQIVNDLLMRGVLLDVRDGDIIAPPSVKLSPHELREIATLKPGMIDAIRAQQAALAPVVVA